MKGFEASGLTTPYTPSAGLNSAGSVYFNFLNTGPKLPTLVGLTSMVKVVTLAILLAVNVKLASNTAFSKSEKV
ncbi:MAG: hypothetical protein RR795_01345 [Cetobacterium sp.]